MQAGRAAGGVRGSIRPVAAADVSRAATIAGKRKGEGTPNCKRGPARSRTYGTDTTHGRLDRLGVARPRSAGRRNAQVVCVAAGDARRPVATVDVGRAATSAGKRKVRVTAEISGDKTAVTGKIRIQHRVIAATSPGRPAKQYRAVASIARLRLGAGTLRQLRRVTEQARLTPHTPRRMMRIPAQNPLLR